MTDMELLRRYVEKGEQGAFAELVRRHVDWLHSAAGRMVGDPGLAHDVTQAVFLVLARRAPSLTGRSTLSPWLFRVLRYAAGNAVRERSRRRKHEQRAARMRAEISEPSATVDWEEVAPLLEEMVARLPGRAREAVLLRFYERLTFAQVGEALGVSEDGARKRVARAVERLRKMMARRGVAAPAGLLAGVVFEQATRAAPATLTTSAVGAGASAKAVGGTTAAGYAKGVMTMMFLAKIKVAAALAAVTVVSVMGVVAVRQVIAQPAAPTPAEREKATRDAALRAPHTPSPEPALTQRDADVRVEFLKVERFARLPYDQQRKALPEFYRDVAPRHTSLVVYYSMNSHPNNILDRSSYSSPPGDPLDRWRLQLSAAAASLTPEQVADKLRVASWLELASHLRTMDVLENQADAVEALIQNDLAKSDPAPFSRGCSIAVLGNFTKLTPRLLGLYLEDSPLSKAAGGALMQLNDPAVVAPLLSEVQKNPKSIIRHAGLLMGPMRNRLADAILLQLLDSPDGEIRYSTAYALAECKDGALAKPIANLSHDADERIQELALIMATHLPDEAFASIRTELAPLLSLPGLGLTRRWAIKAFAMHKDMLAGPVILALLKQDQMDEGAKVDIVQSLGALTDSSFDYDMFHWGPASNQKVIAKFEAWLKAHAEMAR